MACLMRVLAKPEMANAIKFNEFEMLMENFLQQPPNESADGEKPQNGPSTEAKPKKSNKKKKQI